MISVMMIIIPTIAGGQAGESDVQADIHMAAQSYRPLALLLTNTPGAMVGFSASGFAGQQPRRHAVAKAQSKQNQRRLGSPLTSRRHAAQLIGAAALLQPLVAMGNELTDLPSGATRVERKDYPLNYKKTKILYESCEVLIQDEKKAYSCLIEETNPYPVYEKNQCAKKKKELEEFLSFFPDDKDLKQFVGGAIGIADSLLVKNPDPALDYARGYDTGLLDKLVARATERAQKKGKSVDSVNKKKQAVLDGVKEIVDSPRAAELKKKDPEGKTDVLVATNIYLEAVIKFTGLF